MKIFSVLIISFLFLSCDRDNNGIIDGIDDAICWKCIIKSNIIVGENLTTTTTSAQVCTMNIQQIRNFEKENSKTGTQQGAEKTSVKVSCSR